MTRAFSVLRHLAPRLARQLRQQPAVLLPAVEGEAEDAVVLRPEGPQLRHVPRGRAHQEALVAREGLVAVLRDRVPEGVPAPLRPAPLLAVPVEVGDEEVEQPRPQELAHRHPLVGALARASRRASCGPRSRPRPRSRGAGRRPRWGTPRTCPGGPRRPSAPRRARGRRAGPRAGSARWAPRPPARARRRRARPPGAGPTSGPARAPPRTCRGARRAGCSTGPCRGRGRCSCGRPGRRGRGRGSAGRRPACTTESPPASLARSSTSTVTGVVHSAR